MSGIKYSFKELKALYIAGTKRTMDLYENEDNTLYAMRNCDEIKMKDLKKFAIIFSDSDDEVCVTNTTGIKKILESNTLTPSETNFINFLKQPLKDIPLLINSEECKEVARWRLSIGK